MKSPREISKDIANKWTGTAMLKLTPQEVVAAAAMDGFQAGMERAADLMQELADEFGACEDFERNKIGRQHNTVARWLREQIEPEMKR